MTKRSIPAVLGAAAAMAALIAPNPALAAQAEKTDFAAVAASTITATGLDFGDDSGSYALDGECDDLRFDGEGMSQTPMLADDLYKDATDCRAAFRANKIALDPLFVRLTGMGEILWGDDASEFANDGECDDLRFEGPGLTFTPLLVEDIGHDATDCRMQYQAGEILWRSGPLGRIDQPASFA
ncbi:hypothetical protein [Croceicoccus naphthovorans]|uniref:hypothetical protein n=1 Tax=Croceicoccus naphthovorans TaxID=1348774 RepID=UPI00069E16A0|nr:hypothetical protein [Croceicoccus naphthovorans]MBB3988854.1 hypothetical protein [Croceicoccus naphthovorans]